MTVTRRLHASLALDLRSLSLMRVLLGLFLLIDAALRLGDAALLYADSGLLSRAVAVQVLEPVRVSLHLANGSAAFAVAMVLFQVAAATALTLGWRTRASALLLALLLASAAMRNPWAVTAADLLALGVLSLALFVPLNAYWSVDAARPSAPPAPPDAVTSWPALALLLHAATLPLALAYQRLGLPLAAVALLVPALTLAAWVWAPARALALALALLLAVGAMLGTNLGGCGWLLLASAGLLADVTAWRRLAGAPDAASPRVYHDGERDPDGRFARLLTQFLGLPRVPVAPAQDNPRAARLLAGGTRLVVIDLDEQAHRDAEGVAVLLRRSPLLRPLRPLLRGAGARRLGAALLALDRCASARPRKRARIAATFGGGALAGGSALLLAGLLGLSPFVPALGVPLAALGLDRPWIAQLAPSPDPDPTWLLLLGERVTDGREVDAALDALPAPTYTRAPRPLLSGERGHAYRRALLQPQAQRARQALAQHLCARHRGQLARVRVVALLRDADGGTAEQRVLLRHECEGAAQP